MKLKYPEESRRFGEEGTVILAIEIMPDGQHGEIEVVQSSGFWRLDEAALDAARRANYVAVLVDGRPLANKTRIIQPFVFQLKDADGT
jgi:protein TonB